MTDNQYMDQAIREAWKAYNAGEIPVGAILVYKDTILSAAHNLRETQGDPTAHAEILVLREGARRLGRWRLTGCTLYVTIEPCPMCAGAILNARADRLVYGAADEKAGGVHSRFHLCSGAELNHHLSVKSGIKESECRLLIDSFFTSHRT